MAKKQKNIFAGNKNPISRNAAGVHSSSSAEGGRKKAKPYKGYDINKTPTPSSIRKANKIGGRGKYGTVDSSTSRRSYSGVGGGTVRSSSGLNDTATSTGSTAQSSQRGRRKAVAQAKKGPRFLGISRTENTSQAVSSGKSRKVKKGGSGFGQGDRVRTKRSKTSLIVGSVALVVAVVAALVISFGFSNFQLHSQIGYKDLKKALAANSTVEQPFYTLLVGLDGPTKSRKNDPTHADAVMLAKVDPAQQTIALLSLHRDIPINEGDDGYFKLKDVYAYGGPAAMVSAVSDLLDVEIDHYISCTMEDFITFVDELGGIDVDVALNVIAKNDLGVALDLGATDIASGMQQLDGAQALTFVRSNHYAGGIFQADANQRVFVKASNDYLFGVSHPTFYKQNRIFSSCFHSDLTVKDIRTVVKLMDGMNMANVYQYGCPTKEFYDAGGRYIQGETLQVPIDATLTALMSGINQGAYPAVAANDAYDGTVASVYDNVNKLQTSKDLYSYSITVQNGSADFGVANVVANVLTEQGFKIAGTGNASSQIFEETLVIYDDSKAMDTCNAIIDILGCGRAIENVGYYAFDSDILIIVGFDYGVLL